MDFIDRYLTEFETVVQRISREDVRAVVDTLLDAWHRGRMIFIIGNGGSAATASHMMCDLNKSTSIAGVPRFRGLALTDNVPFLTAVGNDISYDQVFVEPLRNLMEDGDVLIAISASGNSPNIVRAVEYAKTRKATIIGLCGQPGGKLAAAADVRVIIPSDRIGQQEDGHLMLNHVVAAALHERLARIAAGDGVANHPTVEEAL